MGEGAELKLYPSVTGLVSAAWAECTCTRKDRKSEGKLQTDYDRITQQQGKKKKIDGVLFCGLSEMLHAKGGNN